MNPDALQNYLMSSNFKLTMTPHQDQYKLPSSAEIPILVSLQSEELFKEEGQTMHVNMDIVCVVDHSFISIFFLLFKKGKHGRT